MAFGHMFGELSTQMGKLQHPRIQLATMQLGHFEGSQLHQQNGFAATITLNPTEQQNCCQGASPLDLQRVFCSDRTYPI